MVIYGPGRAVNFTKILSILEGSPTGESILLETAATLRNDNTGKQENPFCAKNIYDLGGNAGEWTTECFKLDKTYRISGGSFVKYNGPNGVIDDNDFYTNSGIQGDTDISSRPILYK